MSSSGLIFSWLLGGVFLLFGVWIINNLEFGIGVSEFSYAIAMIVSLVFILIAGLLWINTSVGVRHHM
jgi:hypothetical protein